MIVRSIDGIKIHTKTKLKPEPRTESNSAAVIASRKVYGPHLSQHAIADVPKQHFYRSKKLHPAWIFVSIIMLFSFIGGMITVWNTRASLAEQESVNAPAGLVTKMNVNTDDLNIVAILPTLIEQNRHQPTPEEIVSSERRQKLKAYLASKSSPLAKDEPAITALLSTNNLEMILAISFVEGNFCKHQQGYNCSGIGGNGLKEYKNFAEWVKDFDSLLERRYKGLTVEQFKGKYVQPGSQNWIDGVNQILDELKQHEIS